MSDTLGVALLGAGYASRYHAAAWHSQPGALLRCVVDIDGDRAKGLAAEYGTGEWATEFESLVERADIDAVDICLPPRLHLAAATAFLKAGKHVLLEKPFVLNFDEAAVLLAVGADSDATLMVAENWPFSSASRQVQQLVDDGVLGDLFMLRAQNESALYIEHNGELAAPLRLANAGGGFTMTAGIHHLNLAAALMGGIESVFAYATDTPPSAEPFSDRDVAVAVQFGNSGVGVMHFTGRSLHLGERRLAFGLNGTRGTAEFDILQGSVTYTVDGEQTCIEEATPSLGFAEEIAHFCTCIAERRTPLTSVRHQLDTMAAVFAVYRSLYERREVRPADLLTEAGLQTTEARGDVDG